MLANFCKAQIIFNANGTVIRDLVRAHACACV